MSPASASAPTREPSRPTAGGPAARTLRTGWEALRAAAAVGMDSLLLACGLAASIAVRMAFVPGHLQAADNALRLYLLSGACWIAMLIYEGIYSSGLRAADQTDRIVKALTGGLVIMIVISFAAHQAEVMSRAVLVGWYCANLLLFMLIRPRLERLVSWATRHRLVLVVSDAAATSDTLVLALAKAGFRSRVVPWSCDLDDHQVGSPTAVVVCLPAGGAGHERLSYWERRFAHIGILPASALLPLGAESLNLHGIQLFALSHPLDGLGNRACKRLLDIVGAGLLGFIFCPLWLALACAIRLDSPGPICFRHRRLGREGRPFGVLKFRSMAVDAESQLRHLLATNEAARREFSETFKLRHDPRITRTGKFLRRYSLDEIPQLWNVIRGEMSLVGPRPITESEVAMYGEAYPIIASVRPGLTGIWQISGRSDVSYASRQRFDLGYVRDWSISRDLAILLRTVAAVFSPHAY